MAVALDREIDVTLIERMSTCHDMYFKTTVFCLDLLSKVIHKLARRKEKSITKMLISYGALEEGMGVSKVAIFPVSRFDMVIDIVGEASDLGDRSRGSGHEKALSLVLAHKTTKLLLQRVAHMRFVNKDKGITKE